MSGDWAMVEFVIDDCRRVEFVDAEEVVESSAISTTFHV